MRLNLLRLNSAPQRATRAGRAPLAACYSPPLLPPTDASTEDLAPQSDLCVAQPGRWHTQDPGAQALRRERLWFFSYGARRSILRLNSRLNFDPSWDY